MTTEIEHAVDTNCSNNPNHLLHKVFSDNDFMKEQLREVVKEILEGSTISGDYFTGRDPETRKHVVTVRKLNVNLAD